MTLLDQLRARVRDALDAGDHASAVRSADELLAELGRDLDAVLHTATTEGRSTLLASEQRRFDDLRTEIRTVTEQRSVANAAALRARDADLAEHRDARAAADRVHAMLPDRSGHTIRVGAEARTYSGDPSGPSFFGDLFAQRHTGDPGAAARLHRHQAESAVERRDIGVSAISGFVPPQYLVDQYAPVARAGAPLRELVTRLPLPDEGMVVNISRITTGSAVATQATENSAVQETNMDDTLLAVDVRTIAGQQDVSRQLLERSAGAVDQVIFSDLAAAYYAELGRQMIATDGTSGTHLGVLSVSGINSVTYTDASPTVAEFVVKVADAVQRIQANRFAGPTGILMHPSRWAWILAAVDTTGRPLVTPSSASGPANAHGVQANVGYGQAVGELAGVPVWTDANIPTNLGAGTNEDRVIVSHWPDSILWESSGGAPFALRFDETTAGSLTVKLVAYGYSAWTAGRYPAAVSVISGTGLVTPTF